jgi:general secretion pathway protein G
LKKEDMHMQNEQRKAQNRRNRLRRGMSLIEIMVAVTIFVMLSAGVAVYLIPKVQEARVSRTITDIRQIESALTLYRARKGRAPDTGTGLKALVDSQDLKEIPKDPWGNDYLYMLDKGEPVIKSLGADGQEGGEGGNSDIISNNLPKQ